MLQIWRMIESFRHKSLKRFFENDDGRKLPADMLERIRAILPLLDSATAMPGMSIFSIITERR
jgi:proteic killer suppression protein